MSTKDMHEEAELVYIPDEDGNEEEFEVIMKFEVDDTGKKYMMLVPTDQADEEESEVYAFRYEEDGDDLQLFVIEDEEEWDIVEETFNTLMGEDEEDFEDEEEDEDGDGDGVDEQ